MKSDFLAIAAAEIGVTEYPNGNRITDYHTVNKGDNLYRIGLAYNVSVNDLMKWNSLTDVTITVGQQLRIAQRDSNYIDNPRILQYSQEVGYHSLLTDEDAWCASFVAWCAKKAGLPYPNTPMARAWLKVGNLVDFDAGQADVVVFWREGKDSIYGHVGLPLSYSNDRRWLFVLGGNQSNMVCIKPYPVERLLGFVELPSQV